ncbi:ABC transporter ATP-binding protein [Bartonella sp. HY406]|uniref:ABC transporter ATP-binding protein n=1 Tax=Bartonella sp. HY406 TaxID=2979331 RepID=UPI0021C98BB3|nr:ABC transporter ATP-binding protein [Bartonella sp. HY406]UXN05080.1 ABC transporter ATP-binding protein/permease [Bartonella sp. HY406]
MAEVIKATKRQTDKKPDYLASLKLIIRYSQNSRVKIVSSVLLACLAVACELVPVWLVYQLVSAAIAGTASLSTFVLYAFFALISVIISFLSLGFSISFSHIAAYDIIYQLRSSLARHIARVPLGIFANRRSGDAKKLMIDDPETLEKIAAHGLPEGISALVTFIAVSIWLFIVDWRMAIATIIITPLSFVLLTMAMMRGGRLAGAYQAASARMNASMVEYLAAMPVVKIFNRSGESFSQTAKAVQDYTDIELASAKLYLPLGSTFYSLVLANITVILPVGVILLYYNTIDLPTLLFFLILGGNYGQSLLKLFNQFHTLAHISMGSMLIGDLFNTAEQKDSGAVIDLKNSDICFDDVCFSYQGREVLHHISFTAKTGSVTALVGPSGSGKSTMASLIARFYDVDSGKITISGVDVRDIGLQQLMDNVAFVFQDSFLFSDTIEANIRCGNKTASQADIENAAQSAQAHEFILALPQGYNTHLGQLGRRLSGGERQRIAITRAILKNAPIIILDEATAFADPDNEAALQQALGALIANRTLIMIAHRLSTIIAADTILVVDHGQIVAKGNHQSLVDEGGIYAQLWQDYNYSQDQKEKGGQND